MSKRTRAPDRSEGAEPVRQNRARSVAELLPAVGGAALRKYGFVQAALVSRWPEIVGDRLAHACAPESIRFPRGRKAEGTLTLAAAGAHAPVLQHVAPEIAERVNRFFGYAAVARVAIRQGDAPVPAPRPAPPSLRPAALPAELGEGLKTIADPELRAVLASLAAGMAADPPRLPRIS